jgi:hypothetical protein
MPNSKPVGTIFDGVYSFPQNNPQTGPIWLLIDSHL